MEAVIHHYLHLCVPIQGVSSQGVPMPNQEEPSQGVPMPNQGVPSQGVPMPSQEKPSQGVPMPNQEEPSQGVPMPNQEKPSQGLPSQGVPSQRVPMPSQAEEHWSRYLSTQGDSVVVDLFEGQLQTLLQCGNGCTPVSLPMGGHLYVCMLILIPITACKEV